MMYEVDVFYQGIYTVQIEAANQDDAAEIALGRFNAADWPHDSCPNMTSIVANEYPKSEHKKDVGV